MATSFVPKSRKQIRKAYVVAKYSEDEVVFEVDDQQPIGTVRQQFAAEQGLKEEEFRFVTEASATVLVDTDVIAELEDLQDPEADDGASDLKANETKVRRNPRDEEKVKSLGDVSDSFDAFTKRLGFEDQEQLLSELARRCMDANRVDRDFIQQQASVAMRVAMSEEKPHESPCRPKRLVVCVQEGFPLFLVTPFDGVKYMACVGHDTLGEVRDRFARLVECAPEHLVLRKHQETDLISSAVDDLTMDELGMENGCAFDAQRTGLCEFNVVFDFCFCVQISANLDEPVEALMKEVERRAPAFRGVRFALWYNGHVLPDGTGEPLGHSVMGTHFLRVMLTLDPTLPANEDEGPDMRPATPELSPEPPLVETMGDVDGNSLPSSGQPAQLPVDLELNRRALRYVTLLVECSLVENMRSNLPHRPPITLPRCLPSMTLQELRRMIQKESKEEPDDQTLFYRNKLLGPEDNFSTLRELNILGQHSLYLEPPIDVFINLGNGRERLKMRRGGSSTTIAEVHEWIAFKTDLALEAIHLEIRDVAALPFLCFSDYKVKDGDIFVLQAPFRLRTWHDNFLYDKMVWKHTDPASLMQELAHDTGVPVNEQVLADCRTRQKSRIAANLGSLAFCGVEAEMELELWRRREFEFMQRQRREFDLQNGVEAPVGLANQFLASEPFPEDELEEWQPSNVVDRDSDSDSFEYDPDM